jgi:prepilin-type N-terminal cleavage/methylation domain-containing protein
MGARWIVSGVSGVTLLELLVVLTVLGVILGVTGLALSTLRLPRDADLAIALRRARAEAIRTGTARTSGHVRFLPDGRAIGPGVNALTGAPDAK